MLARLLDEAASACMRKEAPALGELWLGVPLPKGWLVLIGIS